MHTHTLTLDENGSARRCHCGSGAADRRDRTPAPALQPSSVTLSLFPLSFSALVWGASVKHNPQKVGKDHVMDDEDVIQLVKK